MGAPLTALLWLLTAAASAAEAPKPPPAEKAGDPAPQGQKEQNLLQEIFRVTETYEQESKAFKREIQALIEQRYKEKRNVLGESYEKAIRDLEVQERKERLDAIAQFEEFLRRYPGDPRYTPDVMFRLAELYYERSSDDQVLAMHQYEEKLKESQKESQGKEAQSEQSPPPEPTVDFSKSIAIYRELLNKFPDYRLNDASYYLLGYCLEKQNQIEQGQEAYHQLIARYPKSKFVTESWVRIGEYHFESYNDPKSLAKAAEAYEMAVKDKQHVLYDKALYKLAWTYYRMDRFDDAVTRFTALLDAYQEKYRGKEEEGGDLRNEALQYTAISFADEKWGSLAKAKAFFQKIGGRPYEAEIYKRLGDVYFDQTKHPEAIEAYRLVLAKDPLSKNAPQIQERIVQAYDRDRKLQDSARESQALADMFKPGTPWFEKHKRDVELTSSAQGLAEKNLYASAVYHHQQGLLYKQEKKAEPAKSSFEFAASSYAAYLTRFGTSKNSYEVEFYLAECLYNSEQFKDAAIHYAHVRDSGLDNKYFKESAFASVLSWQKEVELEVLQHKIPELKPLKSTERKEGQPVTLIPLAEAEKQQIGASDVFVAKLKEDPQAAGIAYKAAELCYAHNDFPEARRRFEEIIKTFPGSEVAKFATNLTVESFLVDKDWKNVEDVSARLAENKSVADPKSELYKDLVKFKLAGRFKLADQLMEKGEYEAAAQKYIALVDEEPRHEFADKALNNAAVAYEKQRKFDSALKLYERVFKEYPNSKLADSALFRVAVNAENSYDFDKAVSRYQQLVRDYPASKNREASLFNAARLLEARQRYPQAAAAFQRYAELFPKNEDAPKNVFRAALIYEKQGDWKSEVKELERFIKSYGNSSGQVELAIDARRRIGDAERKLGNDKEAKLAYLKAASEFDRRNFKVDAASIGAEAAAQSRFQLAEYEFASFDRLKIGGRGKKLERSFAEKRFAVKKVNDAYAAVFKYKRLEWTLAALYRRGYALERFAATIIETPVPPDVKRLGTDAVVAYQDLLGQQTVALEDKAVESYVATLSEARKNHISNEWSKKTLESLNRFRPQEYPVLKDPKGAFTTDILYPTDLVDLTAPSQNAPSVSVQREGAG